MDDVLFIGCGKTAEAITKELVKLESVGKIYLRSRKEVDAKKLEGILKDLGKCEVAAITSPPDEFPKYTVVTLSAAPHEEWQRNIGAVSTTAENRLFELFYNLSPMHEVPRMLASKDTTVIIVTNPVDYLTTYLRIVVDMDRVYGFGMDLDAERYRSVLSSDDNKPPVHCVGIHGEAIPVKHWGRAELYQTAYDIMDRGILNNAKESGIPYAFCGKKFSEFFVKFTGSQESIVSLSTTLNNYGGDNGLSGVCMSIPVRVKDGVVLGYYDVRLNEIERARLLRLVDKVKSYIQHFGKAKCLYDFLTEQMERRGMPKDSP